MNPYTCGFIGENAMQSAGQWYADMCFLSSRCISLEHGCMDNNEDEVSIKQVMMRQSRSVAFLCDSSKFDRTSVRYMAKLEELDYLITEKRPGDAWIQSIEKNNVKLLYEEKAAEEE